MSMTWLYQLRPKERRGSRPCCVLLTDGNGEKVAQRLTQQVDLPDVVVSHNGCWGERLDISGVPFCPLIRTCEQPFNPWPSDSIACPCNPPRLQCPRVLPIAIDAQQPMADR